MERLHFPGSINFINNFINSDNSLTSSNCTNIFDAITNLIEMSLFIFIATTIRCYEDIIVADSDEYKKKVKGIKTIIKERFKGPSIGTLLELSRNCFYLIKDHDGIAPSKLIDMKFCLNNAIQLDSLAFLFNDLDGICSQIDIKETNKIKTKTVYQYQNKMSLNNIIAKIVEYRNFFKHNRELSLIIEDHNCKLNIDMIKWEEALEKIIYLFLPILSHKYIHKNLGQVASFTEFDHGKVNKVDQKISDDDIGDFYNPDTISQLILIENETHKFIDLFPFLLIYNDNLYFYKRTKGSGYEYYSICNNSIYNVPIKRKFNHIVFKIGIKGDRQSLFWSETFPAFNDSNNIKANIPTEGFVGFVGRKKLIKKVKEEIIEIPNRDGILFGPGGVGKTALMLQISKELFEEKKLDSVLFNNIIWVSAKKNYYNPFLDTVVDRDKRFDSLDNIFSAILQFFDYEDVDEYDLKDKEELVLDFLADNKILLILDNFETISKVESEKIIRFFQINVKKYLRHKPNYFKIILTSREQIPTGFHQIKIDGLDINESKLLMKNIHSTSYLSREELSEEQKDKIYAISHGIPIIIIHCFAQIYEFNKPLGEIVYGLSSATNELINFSFSEMIDLLKKDDLQLKIIILLEIAHYPLSIKNIADILEINVYEIGNKISSLMNYQILDRSYQREDEIYTINSLVGLFTERLVLKNSQLSYDLKKRIPESLSFENQIDYTNEEKTIIGMFIQYIDENSLIDGEKFIKKQLEKKPSSIPLKYHYAKFLKEQKYGIPQAINILIDIINYGNNDRNVLRLLVSCFMADDFPNFENAYMYVRELQNISDIDDDITLEIVEFYIRWATFLNLHEKPIDYVSKLKRKIEYQEKATKGIKLLENVSTKKRTHKYYYLLSLGFYNLWEPDNALENIDKAIEMIGRDQAYYNSYNDLRKTVKSALRYKSRAH